MDSTYMSTLDNHREKSQTMLSGTVLQQTMISQEYRSQVSRSTFIEEPANCCFGMF